MGIFAGLERGCLCPHHLGRSIQLMSLALDLTYSRDCDRRHVFAVEFRLIGTPHHVFANAIAGLYVQLPQVNRFPPAVAAAVTD